MSLGLPALLPFLPPWWSLPSSAKAHPSIQTLILAWIFFPPLTMRSRVMVKCENTENSVKNMKHPVKVMVMKYKQDVNVDINTKTAEIQILLPVVYPAQLVDRNVNNLVKVLQEVVTPPLMIRTKEKAVTAATAVPIERPINLPTRNAGAEVPAYLRLTPALMQAVPLPADADTEVDHKKMSNQILTTEKLILRPSSCSLKS
jgi:hypothetical protein